jgi:hypothetical protein
MATELKQDLIMMGRLVFWAGLACALAWLFLIRRTIAVSSDHALPLRVVVLEAGSGRPVPGATLTASWTTGQQHDRSQTAADGSGNLTIFAGGRIQASRLLWTEGAVCSGTVSMRSVLTVQSIDHQPFQTNLATVFGTPFKWHGPRRPFLEHIVHLHPVPAVPGHP